MGERRASLKYRMDNLLKQKSEIDRSLDKHRSQNRMERSNTGYLTLDLGEMNRSASALSNVEIEANQARIQRLVKERQKTLEEYQDDQSLGDPFDSFGADYEPKFYGTNLY